MWLQFQGHSLQSLYSLPHLGQCGDRDKISPASDYNRRPIYSHLTQIYTQGRKGKVAATRIILINLWIFSLRGIFDLFWSHTSGGWDGISETSTQIPFSSGWCDFWALVTENSPRGRPCKAEMRYLLSSLDFFFCQHKALNDDSKWRSQEE